MIPNLSDGASTVSIYCENIGRNPTVNLNKHSIPGTAKDVFTYNNKKNEIITINNGFIIDDGTAEIRLSTLKNWFETNKGNATGSLWFTSDTLPFIACYISKFKYKRNIGTKLFSYVMEITLLEDSNVVVDDPDGGSFYPVAYEPFENAPEPMWRDVNLEEFES